MAFCYLTGVDFPLDEGYLLNRRDAHRLLMTLKDRVGSLQRLVDQLSPLDEIAVPSPQEHAPVIGKRHRLVCKAVAEALASAYPEVRLFLHWPDYQANGRLLELRQLRDHPLYGDAIRAMADQALLQAARLGNRVLHRLDPHNDLPQRARVAIKAGVCIKHHTADPGDLVRLIRTAVFENRGLEELGIPASEHDHFLGNLDIDTGSASRPTGDHGNGDEEDGT